MDILEQSNCPIEEPVPIELKPVRIELDDSLLDRFNELSEDELIDSFGTFTPAQSLNPYMTKLSICSIKKVGLSKITIMRKFLPRTSTYSKIFSHVIAFT